MTLMGLEAFPDVDRVVKHAIGGDRRYGIPIEAYRHGDEYTVVVDVPGVAEEDIDVDVERNVVTIRVTRKAAHQLGDQVYIDERPRGEFVRQLYLGESLDSARVTAERGDGLLTLHIPVDPASKPRRVEIGHNPTNPSPTHEGKQ